MHDIGDAEDGCRAPDVLVETPAVRLVIAHADAFANDPRANRIPAKT
jgi:hypothetical protein